MAALFDRLDSSLGLVSRLFVELVCLPTRQPFKPWSRSLAHSAFHRLLCCATPAQATLSQAQAQRGSTVLSLELHTKFPSSGSHVHHQSQYGTLRHSERAAKTRRIPGDARQSIADGS